jgi:hypothetical protein
MEPSPPWETDSGLATHEFPNILWNPLFQFLNLHSRKDSLDVESGLRKAATYTQKNTNTEETHTDICASSGIRTHDPSVRAAKDSSCLRERGHSDRRKDIIFPYLPQWARH